MNLLVSGINSGLGKYIYHHFGCDGIARGTHIPVDKKYDAVIHCAVSTMKDISHDNLKLYIDDNVYLTKKLCRVPCDKFIYISTVDIYPKRKDYLWKESDKIVISTSPPMLSVYGMTKLMSEVTVMDHPNWLIMRCSSLLNSYSRKNSIIKTLDTSKHWDVFIHESSKICCVLASDIAKFITTSIHDDLTGIYNVAASNYITMLEVSDLVGSDITFGDYEYWLGRVDNEKVCGVAPYFNKTSQEAISQFLLETS